MEATRTDVSLEEFVLDFHKLLCFRAIVILEPTIRVGNSDVLLLPFWRRLGHKLVDCITSAQIRRGIAQKNRKENWSATFDVSFRSGKQSHMMRNEHENAK